MNDVMMAAVIFSAIYLVLKNFTDFLLKRKIIKAGHFDNAGILNQKVSTGTSEIQEANKYPSLKWGLVAFFAGLGFIIIDQMSPGYSNEEGMRNFLNSFLPFGIELVSISFGFITYFLIANLKNRK
jgi:hypothetical protein